jgi:hypothetical protein
MLLLPLSLQKIDSGSYKFRLKNIIIGLRNIHRKMVSLKQRRINLRLEAKSPVIT